MRRFHRVESRQLLGVRQPGKIRQITFCGVEVTEEVNEAVNVNIHDVLAITNIRNWLSIDMKLRIFLR
jgi:hypothetical protein